MLVGKNLIRKLAGSLATVLALAVVVPSQAADVEPLHFDDVGNDHAVQQSYWDNLMRYKMFGTEGIEFAGRNVKVTDKSGWFGTATGDFVLKNEEHEVGGPILIGGDIKFDDGQDRFTSGPVRVLGNISTSNFNGPNEMNGAVCVQGNSVAEKFKNAVPAENRYFGSTATCPEKVPQIDRGLKIPSYNGSTAQTHEAVNVNNGIYPIVVPEGEGTYDLVIPSIEMVNNSKLYIQMPKGGRLTRIFVTGDFKLSSQSEILVQYKNDDGTYTTVKNSDYAGDLLFYVMNDFAWDARKNDYSMQGTYISTGTIHIKQQLTLAGQLLAKNLIIDANFDGSTFNYVPFDAPKFSAKSWGTVYEGVAYEGVAQPLTVTLNKTPKTDVSFIYCFIANGNADAGMESNNYAASEQDLVTTNMPLCRNNAWGRASFTAEDSVLAEPIMVYVKDDGLLENEETFKIVIDSLQGAVASDSNTTRRDTFEITIIDDDKTPVCHDTTLVIAEDDTLTFAGAFPAFKHDGIEPLDVYFEVPIIDVPVQGMYIGGELVLAESVKYRPIPNYLLGDTKYASALNRNNETAGADGVNTHYDSLTFAIELRKGVRSESCKMYIDVTPVNDKPVLNDTVISIRENTPVDSILLQLIAVDYDGDKLTYGVVAGEGDSHFNLIGAVKDSLVLVSGLDYETQKEHKIRVYVTDGKLNDSAYVTIKVTDENEDPKFDEDEYKFIVREHAPYDSIFGIIHATDPDSVSDDASYNKVRYSYKLVSPVKEDSAFWLSDIAGTFAVKNSDSLNYEKIDEYVLWAYATDAKGLYDSVKVTITVDDINEEPSFEQDKYYYQTNFVSIPEDAKSGEILTFNFSDPDFKSILDKVGFHQLKLTLLDCTEKDCKLGSADEVDANVSSMFSIKMNSDSTSGVLSLTSTGASKLNYEVDSTYNMLIEVRDNAKVPALSLADTIVVRVRITNVNESPKFDSTKYTFSVKEHQLDRVKVGEVHATDVDFKTTLTYFLGDSTTFSVDQKTSAFYTKTSLDYEVDSLYTVMVYVTDNDATKPLKDSVPVTIKVIDINETPWAEGAEWDIKEDAAEGLELGKIEGQDPDKFNKNFNQLTYAWADPTQVGADIFAINISTGKVTLAKGGVLDYENEDERTYRLDVKISDNGGLYSIASVIINVIDVNEPPVLRDTTIYVDEDTPIRTNVLTLKAEDPENNTVSYTIISGDPNKTDFSLGTSSGKLSVSRELNFNDKPKYVLTIRAKDNGSPNMSDTATVTVIIVDKNNPPYFLEYEFEFNAWEHNPADTVIGQLEAADEDKNPDFNQLTYRLIDDPSGFFAVSKDGEVSIPEANVLNYEPIAGDPTYVLTVEVSDGMAQDTAYVVVTVLNINEKPTLKNATFSIKEHGVPNDSVGELKSLTTDPDLKESFSYKIIGTSNEFSVGSDGVITTKKELNYETKQTYSFKVEVSDRGNPSPVLRDTATIVVKVVDVNEAPTVGDQEFTILETVKGPASVGTVVGAADKDILNDYFGTLDYARSDTIVDGVVTKGSDFFIINKETGKISVKNGVTFDYETKGKVYYLKLTVTDHADPDKEDAPLSASSLITIKIEDVPEPPHFAKDVYEFDVDENSLGDVVVGELSADDKDEDEKLVYELLNLDGSVSKQFRATYANNKAVIVVEDNAGLDHETLAHYEVMVIVTDKSNLKDTAKVVITVNDVNETPTLEEQYFELDENSGADFKLDGIVEAGDLDTASVFTKHYFTAIGGDTDLFTMNSRGEIFANYDMDYEEYKKMGKTTFVLKTKVTDRLTDVNGDSLFVIKKMYIDLKNVNEDPYVTTDTLEVKENSKTPTLVGMLDAEDPDGPTTFSFSIARASDEFYVETDGSVRVNVGAILDYETKNEYKIYVNVTDKEGATSKEKPVIIKILDVNEAPVLNDTILYVSEDATVDTIFGKVVGSDPDKYNDAFNQLSYGMVSPKDTFDFLTDGSAKLLRRLDYEAITSYVRQVYVTDGFEYDTANVIIKVVNVVESTHVEIIQVDDPDSIWVKPDTIYTNVPDKNIEWIEDDKKYKSDTTLVEGPNVISRCFWDRTKDYEGCDTVIIYYSSSKPIVTVYAEPAKVTAENVYTIVEEKDKSDTTVYVNTFEKEITVSIVDTASGVNSKFTVALELDSVESVSKKTMKDINNIAGEKITIRDGSDVETTKLKITGTDQVVVSYMDTVTINGEKFPVKVSYNTNNKGEETMTEVVNEKGKVEKMQVITVSYTTKGDDGKDVTISYYADAITGEVLNTTSGGQLTKADPGSTSGMAQNAVGTYTVSYDYKDKGNSVNVHYVIDDEGHFVKNEDGDIGYEVSYTYVNKFGNVATKSVFIVVDQVGPKVKILEPDDEGKIKVVSTSFIDVKWTVNGIEQDTLTSQGLEKGLNAVVRFYRDKAGNETSDTVFIMMKNSKTIDIHPEQPVTLVNREKVEEYYADNPPKEGQTYAVSIMNPTSGDEKETLIGGKGKPKEGSGETPYENVDSPYHLGPTLALDIKLPVVRQTDENAKMDGMNTGIVSGLATLDDLVNADGRIPLDGVDANDGEKPTVEEFVEKYCVDGFKVGSDLSKVALYDSKIDIKIWVYTTLGGFVNYYHFAQELNDPDYVNPAGMTKLFFEMKPDKNGDVRTDDGRLLATGSYVYKVEVKLRSELLCSLPPVEDGGSPKKGDVIKNNDQLLTSFGYKRPKE